MDQVNGAIHTLGYYLQLLLGFGLRLFVTLEAACRTLLSQIGVPANIQTVVLLVIDVLLILLILRLLGGVFRVLLTLFLVLLLVHVLGGLAS